MYQLLGESFGRVLGITIGDRITGNDMNELIQALREAIAAHGKIRLLIEVEGFRHMEPDALLEKLKFVKDHMENIELIAVVGTRVWIKSWIKLGGLFSHPQVEYFDRSEIEAAWTWLRRA